MTPSRPTTSSCAARRSSSAGRPRGPSGRRCPTTSRGSRSTARPRPAIEPRQLHALPGPPARVCGRQGRRDRIAEAPRDGLHRDRDGSPVRRPRRRFPGGDDHERAPAPAGSSSASTAPFDSRDSTAPRISSDCSPAPRATSLAMPPRRSPPRFDGAQTATPTDPSPPSARISLGARTTSRCRSRASVSPSRSPTSTPAAERAATRRSSARLPLDESGRAYSCSARPERSPGRRALSRTSDQSRPHDAGASGDGLPGTVSRVAVRERFPAQNPGDHERERPLSVVLRDGDLLPEHTLDAPKPDVLAKVRCKGLYRGKV